MLAHIDMLFVLLSFFHAKGWPMLRLPSPLLRHDVAMHDSALPAAAQSAAALAHTCKHCAQMHSQIPFCPEPWQLPLHELWHFLVL